MSRNERCTADQIASRKYFYKVLKVLGLCTPDLLIDWKMFFEHTKMWERGNKATSFWNAGQNRRFFSTDWSTRHWNSIKIENDEFSVICVRLVILYLHTRASERARVKHATHISNADSIYLLKNQKFFHACVQQPYVWIKKSIKVWNKHAKRRSLIDIHTTSEWLWRLIGWSLARSPSNLDSRQIMRTLFVSKSSKSSLNTGS